MDEELTINDLYSDAQLYFGKGQYDKALDILKHAYKIDSGNYDSNFLIGKCFYNKKQYEKAKKIFSELSERGHEDKITVETINLYLAYTYYYSGIKSGTVDIAQNIVLEVVAKNDKNIFALELLADTHLYNKNYDEALGIYEKIKKAADNISRILYKQALCWYGLKQYSEGLIITDKLYKDKNHRNKPEYKILYKKMLDAKKEEHFVDNDTPVWKRKIMMSLFDRNFIKEVMTEAKGDRRINHVERRMFEKLYKDDLTGLKNKRCFNETILSMFEQAETITFVFCDIDKFGDFNNTYGHEIGDEVLREYHSIGNEVFDGHFYRYGGEEFVAIIFENMDKSFLIAEKFRKTIQDVAAQRVNEKKKMTIPSITCSLGLAEYPQELNFDEKIIEMKNTSGNFEAIRKLANKREHQAKTLGRNQTIFEGAGEDPPEQLATEKMKELDTNNF